MTILYGVAPPLMALRLRHSVSSADGMSTSQQDPLQGAVEGSPRMKQQPNPPQQPKQAQAAAMLPGGRPALIGLCCMATGVTASRLWADVGQPSISSTVAEGAAAAVSLSAAVLSAFHQ